MRQALAKHGHLDVYEALRFSGAHMISYSQKAVERMFGIHRHIGEVTGSNYYTAYREFLTSGSLKALFYNIEDSVGCLQILNQTRKRHLGRRRTI
jgi:uncharacterized protein YprB with RNaseH-like and TPR domain